LVYPAVLIGLSIIMLMLMAVFVVPNFSKFYGDLGAELPAITQITLGISFFLRDNILWILLGLLVAGFAFRAWKRTPKGRMMVDRMRLKLPILGTIFRYFSLGEFCRSMSTLLAGGIPLVSALDTAIESVSNSFIAHRIQPATGNVREGETFFASLEKTEQFPHMAVDMVKVGEATGSLDEMLASVADYFDEHVETRMQRLLSLVEPFMLVIMGVIIAVLLISIYLPMFDALGQVGN
jgi:type IV pilus assembly protein PilC